MIKRYSPAIILLLLVSIIFSVWLLSEGNTEISEATQPKTGKIFCPQSCILAGRTSLEMGNFEKALIYLTAAYDEMPHLGDYILFWRADAFAGKLETEKALEDLAAIRTGFPDSPLLKKVRTQELEILKKSKSENYLSYLLKYMEDYPSDNKAKFYYAVYLKNNGGKDRARTLFREIYASVSPYSKKADDELSDSDIRAADLLNKGRNLNKAWHFRESEKYFRKALLKKDSGPLSREINEGIALSLFKQKKYKEAAAQYAKCGDPVMRARSLFRAGDMEGFRKAMASLVRKNDPRVTALMINYGSKKRRGGDSEGAVSIFTDVMARFPAAKEEALWQKGWTFYRNGNLKEALEIFNSLHSSYGGARYLYWKNRCLEKTGADGPVGQISHIPNSRNNNFYFLMSALRGKGDVPAYEGAASARCSDYSSPKRVETLDMLGFKKEAAAEIAYIAKRSSNVPEMACLSSFLQARRDYKTSIALAERIPYRTDLHGLYYPLAYFDVVEEASKANDLDPLLALAIIREESRFAFDARSPAGALGLMQLMPQTASRLSRKAGVSLSGSEELYNVKTNITLGTYYLSSLVRHFGSAPPAIASYNAGEDRVKEWLSAGKYGSMDEFIEDIPYDETRNYVKKVMTSYLEYLRLQGRKEIPALLIRSWNL
jgi:soluble lytic murein transglycosylase